MDGLEDTVKPALSGHPKRRPKMVSRLIIAECRSKVLQNAPREHSAILLTFIKLSFVFKTFVLSNLSGRLRQVLLYSQFYPQILHNWINDTITAVLKENLHTLLIIALSHYWNNSRGENS